MKKFISLMLAGLLSASLFAFGASAAKEIGGDNGVNDFDSKDTVNNINVKVENVTHMYAVDLTFSFDDLSIGNWEWNVNTMQYDIKNAPETDTTRTIEVSNRSDLPVYAYGVVNDSDDKDNLTVAMTEGGRDSDNKLTVGKATAGTESNGTATQETLTVSLSSGDWNAVAQYYINKQQAETTDKDKAKTYTVATVTVTICKAG